MGVAVKLEEFWEEKRQRDAVASQTQRKQDENVLLRKGTKSCG